MLDGCARFVVDTCHAVEEIGLAPQRWNLDERGFSHRVEVERIEHSRECGRVLPPNRITQRKVVGLVQREITRHRMQIRRIPNSESKLFQTDRTQRRHRKRNRLRVRVGRRRANELDAGLRELAAQTRLWLLITKNRTDVEKA